MPQSIISVSAEKSWNSGNMWANLIFVLYFSFFFGQMFSNALEIGDNCEVLNRRGVCLSDKECPSFQLLSHREKQAIFQARCGFQVTPIICCFTSRKSKDACDNLEPRPVKKPTKRNKLSDAKDAENGEFPQFAALGYREILKEKIEYKCGGTLISKNFVLTAAQCLSNPVKLVTLGTVALKAGVNLQAYLQRVDMNVKVRTKQTKIWFPADQSNCDFFRTNSSTQIIHFKPNCTT